MLEPKAKASLKRYGHQVVIANILETRKFYVMIIYADGAKKEIRLSPAEEHARVEIEKLIVRELLEQHSRWRSRSAKSQ